MDPEPGIEILRNKFRIVSELVPFGYMISESSLLTDSLKLKFSKEWMASFTSKLVARDLENEELTVIIASVTVLPDESAEEIIDAFRPIATGQFTDFLDELIANKKGIKTSDDVIAAIAQRLSYGSFTESSEQMPLQN